MSITKLKIRVYGDPCLRQRSTPVDYVGPGERLLINAMIETMLDHKGVGLAAPQVGINKRIFVADVGEGPMVFVNPQIIKRIGTHVMEEGCLSIPGVQVHVKRADKVLVQYKDELNQQHEASFNDLLARVVQHETDHLDGKLIIDYLSRKELSGYQGQLNTIEASSSK